MSVRVVARIRPLLKAEIEKDIIVHAEKGATAPEQDSNTVVRIPNPKNVGENFSFQFNSVYDREATQAEIFDNEVASTVKHLFKGFDVTIFAYGVTGTGKTHTMRGGKSLSERGVIPRLLSSIYRRARKTEKDSAGESVVDVSMSYFEIYNDKVFDLFEEKRTPSGLPIRDNEKGKAIVVGLTERPCTSLKEFEGLYDAANINRSTSATKLNAHSSRSHAILCVKISQTTGEKTRVSTVSAIDLAGSEDNRRTDNNKERLVESAAINKSLFVLAQCVEAISKGQTRIPYRESKMTRILALGQNKSHTVCLLNLAPVKSYHLDTLSSLNFANRTKKIETNEIENQPFYRDVPGKGKVEAATSAIPSQTLNRQPLRPKILSHNSHLLDVTANVPKPTKQFSVYSDKPAKSAATNQANTSLPRNARPVVRSPKRPSPDTTSTLSRPAKMPRTVAQSKSQPGLTQSDIESLIEKKVSEALAERADTTTVSNPDPISDEVQKRLDALEKRVEGRETERAEGLQYLLMAKQHQVRGEEASALKMYTLAQPHFPGNEKLMRKIVALREKLEGKKVRRTSQRLESPRQTAAKERDAHRAMSSHKARNNTLHPHDSDIDSTYYAPASVHADSEAEDSDANLRTHTKIRRRPQPPLRPLTTPYHSHPHRPADADIEPSDSDLAADLSLPTPRTARLLQIINSRDVSQIRLLKGVGSKRADAIVGALCEMEDGEMEIRSLQDLGRLRGVGQRTVEGMRSGC